MLTPMTQYCATTYSEECLEYSALSSSQGGEGGVQLNPAGSPMVLKNCGTFSSLLCEPEWRLPEGRADVETEHQTRGAQETFSEPGGDVGGVSGAWRGVRVSHASRWRSKEESNKNKFLLIHFYTQSALNLL